ncbi:MAG: hypothetical protein WD939_03245 [Dehalococcoidia bacterium]
MPMTVEDAFGAVPPLKHTIDAEDQVRIAKEERARRAAVRMKRR